MEALFILVPVGFFVGWAFGIAGFVQARRARAEIAALRGELAAAGVRVTAPPPYPWGPRIPGAAPEEAFAPPPDLAGTAASAAASPPPSPETEPAPAAAAPPAAPPGRTLEEALTLRWGVWLGAAALLLAGVFLVRYAVEEGWLGPAARCALATLLGFGLVAAGEWLRRKPLTRSLAALRPDHAPPALVAGGVACLFGAAYAAAVMYALVPPVIGFALMAAAGLFGLMLALVHGPVVGVLGLAAAFVTPALVETRDPSLPGLFGYLLVVTAAAMTVVRFTAWAWLGWMATVAGAFWVVLAAMGIGSLGWDLLAPALFVPAAATLNLALLPAAALEHPVGRRLAWVPFAALGIAALTLNAEVDGVAPALAILLLTPVAVAKGISEPRLDRLPWLAAALGLAQLLLWPLPGWVPTGEAVTIEGVVQGIIPGPWFPEPLRPFLIGAALLAAMHAAAGLWRERHGPHPLHWAALAAAVPVLVLLVAYSRARGFAADVRWALLAVMLAAGLTAAAARAMRDASEWRAGAHAAGTVAALALGVAMVLAEHWLTLGVALFLPPLAWIAGRTGLRPLRQVALAVATVVLVRLLLNRWLLSYDFSATPLLNGLLLAYGVPALCFALAARRFRRNGDDGTVAVLEAGALAFLTALVLLQIRHAATQGRLAAPDWGLWEAGWQATALLVLGWLGLRANRWLRRPVLRWGWITQVVAGLLVGLLLLVSNPAVTNEVVGRLPVANALLPAFGLPALLAGLILAARETRRPHWLRLALAGYALLSAFAWVTLEVRHAFHPERLGLDAAPVLEAELWAWSGAWLVFGALLVLLGIRTGHRALRLAALAVIGLTTAKVFLVDMRALVGLWRVLSFLGLGLALIALGAVYQRFVLPPRPPRSATPAGPAGEEVPPA